MFASVRTYRADAAQIDDLLHILDEKFMPRITEADGFCGYQAVDCGDGALVTVSCFSSRDQAEESSAMAADFIREELSGYDIERLDVKAGEVRVNMAAEDIMEPAHV